MFSNKLGQVVVAIIMAALILKTHYHAVIWRFDAIPQMIDSGWLAYLFGRIDPMLQNPVVISDNSFHAFHLSPLIYLWTLPVVGMLGLEAEQSFALFHYLAGLFAFMAFLVVGVRRAGDQQTSWIALGLGGAFVITNLHMAEALEFPHHEIMFVGLCALMFAFLLRGWMIAAAVTALLLILLREDGGFYAAYVTLTHIAIDKSYTERRLIALFVFCFLGAVGAFAIQAAMFEKVQLFKINFVGDGFSHVTPWFLGERILSLLGSFRSGGLVFWAILATVFARRWLGDVSKRVIWVPIMLMSPLLILHVIAVRDTLGLFRVYYALPFAIIVALILLSLLHRIDALRSTGRAIATSSALILMTSIFYGHMLTAHNQIGRFERLLTYWPGDNLASYKAPMPDETSPAFAMTCFSDGSLAISSSKAETWQMYPIRANSPETAMDIVDACKVFFVHDWELHRYQSALRTEGFSLDTKIGAMNEYRR